MKTRIKKVPCDVYSRVVGFFRPLSEWNPGKKSEFAERKTSVRDRFDLRKNLLIKVKLPVNIKK